VFADFDPDAHGEPVAARVRPAVATDLDACAQLAWSRNGGELDSWHRRLAGDIADPSTLVVVAEVADAVGGYASAQWLSFDQNQAANIEDGWYLTGVTVEPSLRRRGLGRALLQARLGWISERADRAWYFASAVNEASLQLHRELGFREVTRSFSVPGVSFTGGVGVLSVCVLAER
jgi:ribosomal protein S18 acetylase RimI-like enzyme